MMNQYRFAEMRRAQRPGEAAVQQGDCCALPSKERSLAMVYAVAQKFEDLYALGDALYAGTLFKQLDKPFHKGFRL